MRFPSTRSSRRRSVRHSFKDSFQEWIHSWIHSWIHRGHIRTRRVRVTPETLEPRWVLSAALEYPADLGDTFVTDLTLVAESSGGLFLRLYETANMTNQVASVQLDDAGDVDVNITRPSEFAASAASDTLRIDLDSFTLLNTFVAMNGGVLDLDFAGGTEVPFLTDDHLRVEGSGTFSLSFGLTLHSTCDVTINTGFATFGGNVTVKSDKEITVTGSSHIDAGANDILMEAAAMDNKGLPVVDGILFTATSKITVDAQHGSQGHRGGRR